MFVEKRDMSRAAIEVEVVAGQHNEVVVRANLFARRSAILPRKKNYV